jgi:hypothetical protein
MATNPPNPPQGPRMSTRGCKIGCKPSLGLLYKPHTLIQWPPFPWCFVLCLHVVVDVAPWFVCGQKLNYMKY